MKKPSECPFRAAATAVYSSRILAELARVEQAVPQISGADAAISGSSEFLFMHSIDRYRKGRNSPTQPRASTPVAASHAKQLGSPEHGVCMR